MATFAQPDRPRRDLIKRIIGLPGDTIAIESKRLIRGGVPVIEDWASHTDHRIWSNNESTPPSRRVRDHLDELVIPADEVFCLGDNRDRSQDSRVFGPVPRLTLRGRALLIYWSFDGSKRNSARGLQRLFYLPLNFIGKTRWERQFSLVR